MLSANEAFGHSSQAAAGPGKGNDMFTLNTVYWIANICALSGWVLLFCYSLLPSRWVSRAGIWIPAALSIGYLCTVIFALPFIGGGFGSLESLAGLYQHPIAVLAGWVHYLAFDLFLGGWQVRRAQAIGLPVSVVLPCLLLTMVFGPVGLLLFCLVQWWWQSNEQVSRDSVAGHSSHT